MKLLGREGDQREGKLNRRNSENWPMDNRGSGGRFLQAKKHQGKTKCFKSTNYSQEKGPWSDTSREDCFSVLSK